MPRVVYNIPENAKEEVLVLMRKEKNIVVKERLLAVSMFLDGVKKGDIKMLMHRSANYVGTWISAYFSGGLEALSDKRGGNHSSYLNDEQMKKLKSIITNSHPVYAKGWDGNIIVDLIEYHFDKKYIREGVYSVLKRLNLTHKIATKTDPKKSEIKIATWKEEVYPRGRLRAKKLHNIG
ncbi:MAG: winged helix-turn-helix domain-containing protein [Sulfurimonas sp.]|nr:winged helix-turn-helix domain-containing protein [Sulfurimonas sp.]MDQ7061059.1 winged helix-turn-helix domain-containing protein [Sulfurimonas sp.]